MGAMRMTSTVQGIALALAALFLSSSAFAQYRWTDADGRTIYGDNPPREARNIQPVDARGASGEADALAGLSYESRRAAERFPVVLYTTAKCPPCDAGRELLRARGVPYSERTISTKEDSAQLDKLGLGQRLPIMTLGRQVQREFETTAWHAALDAAGYPRSAQLPRNFPLTAAPLAPRPATAAPLPAGDTPSTLDAKN
jgi:Domain of unknown function (DUF4124)/Glutaredoxin